MKNQPISSSTPSSVHDEYAQGSSPSFPMHAPHSPFHTRWAPCQSGFLLCATCSMCSILCVLAVVLLSSTPSSSSTINPHRHLMSLDLRGCVNLLPARLNPTLEHCSCLQQLNLAGCKRINNTLTALTTLTNLVSLDVSGMVFWLFYGVCWACVPICNV